MATTTARSESPAAELRQKQIEQAEELLFSGPQKQGFVKDLFFGKFRARSIMPFPEQSARERAAGDEMVNAVRKYAREHIDAAQIDRDSEIPQEVVLGLGDIGVLGATVSPEFGGRGLSQFNYCRVMEIIGGWQKTPRLAAQMTMQKSSPSTAG